MNALVSVIVPIYKVEKYLSRCIESIINQSYYELDIILVDDGSPDNCGFICDSYGANDERITVVHKENGGVVSARQSGISAAKGKFVLFVDGDDYIASDYVEKLVNTIQETASDVVICGFIMCWDDGTKRDVQNSLPAGIYEGEKLVELKSRMLSFKHGKEFSFGLYPVYWNKIFLTEFLRRYVLDISSPIAMGDDMSAIVPALCSCDKVVIISDCLYYYQQSVSTMTKSFDPQYFDKIEILLKYLGSRLACYDYMQQQLFDYEYYMLQHGLHTLFNKQNRKSKETLYSTMRSLSDSDFWSKRLDEFGKQFNDKVCKSLAKQQYLSTILNIYAERIFEKLRRR